MFLYSLVCWVSDSLLSTHENIVGLTNQTTRKKLQAKRIQVDHFIHDPLHHQKKAPKKSPARNVLFTHLKIVKNLPKKGGKPSKIHFCERFSDDNGSNVEAISTPLKEFGSLFQPNQQRVRPVSYWYISYLFGLIKNSKYALS